MNFHALSEDQRAGVIIGIFVVVLLCAGVIHALRERYRKRKYPVVWIGPTNTNSYCRIEPLAPPKGKP